MSYYENVILNQYSQSVPVTCVSVDCCKYFSRLALFLFSMLQINKNCDSKRFPNVKETLKSRDPKMEKMKAGRTLYQFNFLWRWWTFLCYYISVIGMHLRRKHINFMRTTKLSVYFRSNTNLQIWNWSEQFNQSTCIWSATIT